MDTTYDQDPKSYSYIWFAIHIFAICVTSLTEQKTFEKFMNSLRVKLLCDTCGKHLGEFMEEFPIKNYFGRAHGCFRWSWKLHNDVNKRLGKPLVEYKDAYNYYMFIEKNRKVCLDCSI